METPPMFSSVEDECRYWKERAKHFHKDWTDCKHEYDEYVEQSRQMEAEMDATIEQNEALISDLRYKLDSFEKENESLKRKMETNQIELSNMEKQLESLQIERDETKKYLRQLEQKNDDLERAHRIVNESLADFERMLDKAYEKNALLEMEVDEKEKLQEKLQRLMDETRDLKHELNIKSRSVPNGVNTNGSILIGNGEIHSNDINNSTPGSPATTPDISLKTITNAATNKTLKNNTTSNCLDLNNQLQHQQHTSLKRKPFTDPENVINGNAMTPSSRTTALNIVADMLRKLNAMETKLRTYREQGPVMPPRP